jgi:hypothetical protein
MKPMRKRQVPEILNRGSLLTYRDNGTERCFGYLFEFPGHGTYEPTFGKLDVTSEEAGTHNALLSQAEISGLDNNCAVGMGGMFYTRNTGSRKIVVTWLGDEVSQDVRIKGSVLTFQRKGMTFRGRLRKAEDCFTFRRIPLPRRRRITPAGAGSVHEP